MRIDPKGEIAGYPALLVRNALRNLRTADRWSVLALEAAAKLPPGAGRSMAKALQKNGLIELTDPGRWTVTQAGRTTAAATAARQISPATAENALAQFLERVTRVNSDPYFLAGVTRVVLFGSMLRPEVKWLSDVDLAVQIEAKEKDFDRLRAQTMRRVEELAAQGHCFRGGFLEQEAWWYFETRRFLKGGSRVLSLADYNVEKALVLAGPHRVLIGIPEESPGEAEPETPKPARRKRRPRDCPF
jgi:predicted nucleotidyltransferase